MRAEGSAFYQPQELLFKPWPPFGCKYCKYVNNSWERMVKHFLTRHHLKDQCPYCFMYFVESDLMGHIMDSHRTTIHCPACCHDIDKASWEEHVVSGNHKELATNYCNACKLTTFSAHASSLHQKYVHGDFVRKKATSGGSGGSENVEKPDRDSKAPIIDNLTSKEENFRHHQGQTSATEREITCSAPRNRKPSVFGRLGRSRRPKFKGRNIFYGNEQTVVVRRDAKGFKIKAGQSLYKWKTGLFPDRTAKGGKQMAQASANPDTSYPCPSNSNPASMSGPILNTSSTMAGPSGEMVVAAQRIIPSERGTCQPISMKPLTVEVTCGGEPCSESKVSRVSLGAHSDPSGSPTFPMKKRVWSSEESELRTQTIIDARDTLKRKAAKSLSDAREVIGHRTKKPSIIKDARELIDPPRDARELLNRKRSAGNDVDVNDDGDKNTKDVSTKKEDEKKTETQKQFKEICNKDLTFIRYDGSNKKPLKPVLAPVKVPSPATSSTPNAATSHSSTNVRKSISTDLRKLATPSTKTAHNYNIGSGEGEKIDSSKGSKPKSKSCNNLKRPRSTSALLQSVEARKLCNELNSYSSTTADSKSIGGGSEGAPSEVPKRSSEPREGSKKMQIRCRGRSPLLSSTSEKDVEMKDCPKCPKMFPDDADFYLHIVREHEPLSIYCFLCGYVGTSSAPEGCSNDEIESPAVMFTKAHRYHMTTEPAHKEGSEKRWTCRFCDAFKGLHSEVSKHVETNHSDRIHLCTYCSMYFPSLHGLAYHVAYGHKLKLKCLCPHCLKRFDIDELEGHFESISQEGQLSHTNTCFCLECCQLFQHPKAHIECAVKEGLRLSKAGKSCPICHFKNESEEGKKQHEQQNHVIHRCDQCALELEGQLRLESHKKICGSAPDLLPMTKGQSTGSRGGSANAATSLPTNAQVIKVLQNAANATNVVSSGVQNEAHEVISGAIASPVEWECGMCDFRSKQESDMAPHLRRKHQQTLNLERDLSYFSI